MQQLTCSFVCVIQWFPLFLQDVETFPGDNVVHFVPCFFEPKIQIMVNNHLPAVHVLHEGLLYMALLDQAGTHAEKHASFGG
jgi:hypothetical protein